VRLAYNCNFDPASGPWLANDAMWTAAVMLPMHIFKCSKTVGNFAEISSVDWTGALELSFAGGGAEFEAMPLVVVIVVVVVVVVLVVVL